MQYFILIILTVICAEKGIGVFVPPDWEDDSIELTEPNHKIKPPNASTTKQNDIEHTKEEVQHKLLEKESISTNSKEKTDNKPLTSEISNSKAGQSSNEVLEKPKPTNNKTKRKSHTNEKNKKSIPKHENLQSLEEQNKTIPMTNRKKSRVDDKKVETIPAQSENETNVKKKKSRSSDSNIKANSAKNNSNKLSDNKNNQPLVDKKTSSTIPSKNNHNKKKSKNSSSKNLSMQNSKNSLEPSKSIPSIPIKNETKHTSNKKYISKKDASKPSFNKTSQPSKTSSTEIITSLKPTPIKLLSTTKSVSKNKKLNDPVRNGPFPISYDDARGLLYDLNKVSKVVLLKIVLILEMCGNSLKDLIRIIKKKNQSQNSLSESQTHYNAISIMNAFNSIPYKSLPSTIKELDKSAVTKIFFQNVIAKLKQRLKVILQKVNENLRSIIDRARS